MEHSIDAIVQSKVANAFTEQKKLIFREIGEVFLSFARGVTAIVDHVVETEEVPTRRLISAHAARLVLVDTKQRRQHRRVGRPKGPTHQGVSGKAGWAGKFDNSYFDIVKKLGKRPCAFCGDEVHAGMTPECEKYNRHNGHSHHNLRAELIRQYKEKGIEVVRSTWRFLCHGCMMATSKNRVKHFGDIRMPYTKARALFLKVFGLKCPECGKTPHGVKELLCDGPGTTTQKRLENFVVLYFQDGEAAARKQFSLICRSCATKAGVGPSGKSLHQVHAA